ncbi:MAG: hypothetical protein ACOCR0_03450 [Haloferacaceae archaeon]
MSSNADTNGESRPLSATQAGALRSSLSVDQLQALLDIDPGCEFTAAETDLEERTVRLLSDRGLIERTGRRRRHGGLISVWSLADGVAERAADLTNNIWQMPCCSKQGLAIRNLRGAGYACSGCDTEYTRSEVERLRDSYNRFGGGGGGE